MGFIRKEPEQEEFEMEERGNWKKRRRKDLLKPWGKKERYLVLAMLLLTVVSSSILALSARAWKLPGLPKLELPSLGLSGSKTLIFEGNIDNESEKRKAKSEKITREFREKTIGLSGIYALYVIDLSSGYSFGVNENETMEAASLIKLPVMAATYKSAEAGEIKLDDKVKGSEKTYRELLRAMGKRSDNAAQLTVVDVLGRPLVQKTASELGMNSTNYEENKTSPKDVGEYFRKLWKGEIINNENKEELLGFLTDTIYEEYLKAGVPEEVRVAHKYGTILHVINDAGIVYAERPYVIVIMTKGIIEKETKEIFPQLSKLIYDEMDK